MNISADQFVARLRAEVPEFADQIEEHIADNDELLPHLLLGDLARACVTAWQTDDSAFNLRALTVLDEVLAESDGDDYMGNAISVSFVEHVGPWDPSIREFIADWPPALLQDARRAGFADEVH